jgi:cobalt-zinc-cadmium efflux system membrane fusion protein
MKTVLVVVASIALCACGQKNTAAPSDAAPKPKEKQSVSTITVDETAQQKAHIAVASVAAKEISESVTAPGQLTISEDQTWRVGAVVSGKIDDLTARVGDFLRAGQIVGRIHSHDVHEARAAYQQASTELERARAAEAYSRRLRDRAQRLFELKAGSRQEVETAEAELRNAQAAIDKAQSEIAKERAHLRDILRVPVDDGSGSSQNAEEGVPIFAPASGVVMTRKATTGSVVNAGDELLSLSDTRSLWMIAAANEMDLSKLRPGQAVRIEVRAYPGREFNGRILKLGEQLDPTTRTLQIRILVPNPQGLLKPEMYATASLPEGGRRSILLLPEAAIQDIDGVPAVFVRRSATEFEPRAVKTGRHMNGEAEITEGLNAGDIVVVKGAFLLKSQMLRRAIEE